MSWITAPFAWLLKALYDLTGSYGWAVVLFGVVVNLILLPFMAKSKKSMMRTSRLQPDIFSSPAPITFIPYRNSANPPMRVSTPKISISISFCMPLFLFFTFF